jgi:hypothetical protein
MENSFYIREVGLPRTTLVNINYMNSICLKLGGNTMKEMLFGFYQHTQFFSQVSFLEKGRGGESVDRRTRGVTLSSVRSLSLYFVFIPYFLPARVFK